MKGVYFDVCITDSTFAEGRYVVYIVSVKINFKRPCVYMAGLRTCLVLIPSQLNLTKGFTQALPTSNVTPTPTPPSDCLLALHTLAFFPDSLPPF